MPRTPKMRLGYIFIAAMVVWTVVMSTVGRRAFGLDKGDSLDETVAGTIWLIGIGGIAVVWVIVGSLTGPRR